MTKLQAVNSTLLSNYETILPIMEASSPAHFTDIRAKGYRRFSEFGFPTTKDEEFRYLPLREVAEAEYRFGFGANITRSELEMLPFGDLDAHTIVFVNGQFAPEASSLDHLPAGVIVAPFAEVEEALVEELGTVATYENKLGSSNDDRFVALNAAYLAEGAVIRVTKSVIVDKPIHILYLGTDTKATMTFPRNLIVIEENAQASIVETYLSNGAPNLTVIVSEIIVQKAGRLEHNKHQFESETATHISNTFVHQEQNSVYTNNLVGFGSKISRSDINVWSNGEHTESWLNGVCVGTEDQIHDNHTRIDHAMPNSVSFEVYKTILKDKAVGVFNGKIFVYEDAQKTDAKQTNQALLLSPTATMNTKPQLEIFADDVKCTHGATIGQLSDEAMFYLRARGIPAADAQALLVYAFAAENLAKVSEPILRAKLETALFAKLN